MESFFSRFKNPFVLLAILLAQTFALAVQVRRPADASQPDGPKVRLLRLWTVALFTPLERASTGTGHAFRYGWSNYLDLRHVRREDADLRREIETLRLQKAALAEDALEGQRLQALLHFREQYVSQTVAAQVIGTSGSDGSRVLYLDKGANDGLKPDMPVITPDGIVGKLRDVGASTSQLLLINDTTAGAGVSLASTRIRAILHGTPGGRVVISNLTEDARIKPGETVLTSGGDQVFPRGLPVGTIEKIAPDPEHQPYTLITLHTAANLNQLEEVLVITGLSSTLGPEVASELTTDAAAVGTSRAGSRLPSLNSSTPDPAHPDGTPGQPPAQPAGPPPGEHAHMPVIKPPTALHPDQYSPGSTPPATDLTPGGPH